MLRGLFFVGLSVIFPGHAFAKACIGFGPQTPRDISSKKGTNPVQFSFAPAAKDMNLCNIHFHKNAEHKGPGYSLDGGEGDHGGFKCNDTPKLTAAQLSEPKVTGCENIKPGDTVEVHWVHTSCDVAPGKGLGSCLSDACPNPQLRVETQVFLVVNDNKAQAKFSDYVYTGKRSKSGYHQAKKIPAFGDAVQFLGSTTGPSYTEEKCSPLQVTWNVREQCATLDINTLNQWCKKNVFEEDHAHGVRKLVTNPALLDAI
ncbi:cadmium carbonic anhydrase [bacterium]|nr:cadmium carbonic anhydrase [bacterium]